MLESFDRRSTKKLGDRKLCLLSQTFPSHHNPFLMRFQGKPLILSSYFGVRIQKHISPDAADENFISVSVGLVCAARCAVHEDRNRLWKI